MSNWKCKFGCHDWNLWEYKQRTVVDVNLIIPARPIIIDGSEHIRYYQKRNCKIYNKRQEVFI